jgi:1-acyl-sn-glycerol-3-phosphate acyltransferase
MRLYKLIALFMHLIVAVLFTALFAGLLRIPSHTQRYRQAVMWWHRRVCKLLGIQLSITGKPTITTTLYVSNHISWMDIPLLASIVDPHFLSKAEVRSWPIIGWVGAKAGTLFIKRGSRSAAESAHHEMVQCLKANETGATGHSVLFFPEGTTSNGVDILRFRPRLFDAAITTQRPIQPIVLYYSDSTHGVNPKVPFVGKQSLIANIWDLLGERKINVTVQFLTAIDTATFNRKDLAELSEKRIRKCLTQLLKIQKTR